MTPGTSLCAPDPRLSLCGVIQAGNGSKEGGQAIVHLAAKEPESQQDVAQPRVSLWDSQGRCRAVTGGSQELRALEGHCSPRGGLLLVYSQGFSM